jgi:adenylosuccinate synthase
MLVSDRAHLVTQYQISQDIAMEEKQSLGTTKKGIGPTYAAKIQRFGLQVGDLKYWDGVVEKFERMKEYYP